jgi:hypothetical protein
MKTEVVTVTPGQAAEWLEKNTFNRKVSPHVVSKYARDMRSGKWELNHQGIAFDEIGVLADGQHRLHAIVKSNVPVMMMVTYGASRVGVDELRVRRQHEVVQFGGMSDWVGRSELEVAKSMLAFFGTMKSAQYSTASMVEFCELNKDAIMFANEEFASHKKGISVAGCRAVFAVATYHYERRKLSMLIDSVNSGIISGAHQVVAVKLRDMLMSSAFSGGGSVRMQAAKKVSRAIKAYCEDEVLTKIQEPQEFCFRLPESRLV